MNFDLQELLPWIDLTDEDVDFHSENTSNDGRVLNFEVQHLGDGGFNLYYSEENDSKRSDTIFSLETNEGQFVRASLYGSELPSGNASEYVSEHADIWKALFEENALG
jgi:hypothetical protein